MPRIPAAYESLMIQEIDFCEKAEEEARDLINRAYDAIGRRKIDALASVAEGSAPLAIRLRAAIRRDAETQTALARELWDATVADLLADGEISEALDRKWTSLIDPARAEKLWPTMAEAAE